MKKENTRESVEDRFKKLRIRDLNDDAFMVAENLRQPMRQPRDAKVWVKTDKEKKLWKKYRRFPAPNYNWPAPSKSIPIPGNLIVYTSGFYTGKSDGKKPVFKTTFSHKCIQSDIPYLIRKYKTDRCRVIRYSWNGKTYSPDSLPFWGR